ncbi:cytochrome c nitrite reductase pentaheme subunit [Actinobacillus porcinus]|uniref:cytochrome c nitrite reductase pentaheme subunit n=1 Tax=Actinobacillus porcinus TaxID=51048 RepID=UPI0023555DEE|nr:cytochrome c nitrite reductase pentaheme subunit [Actinobacillus porcinus]
MNMNLLTKLTKFSALLAAMLCMVSSAQAETSSNTAPAVAQQVYEPELENDRNPNEYCAKCHSLDASSEAQAKGEFHAGKFHGIHLEKLNPTTGKPITCVSCHGNITENHRKGVKDVMRFHGLWDQDQTIKYSAAEQNQVCFSCHQPEKLQEKFWAHDVHSIKLPCASCHKVHPEKEPMKGIESKERVKLCVDCHGEQQKQKEAREQQSTTEKKDKK